MNFFFDMLFRFSQKRQKNWSFREQRLIFLAEKHGQPAENTSEVLSEAKALQKIDNLLKSQKIPDAREKRLLRQYRHHSALSGKKSKIDTLLAAEDRAIAEIVNHKSADQLTEADRANVLAMPLEEVLTNDSDAFVAKYFSLMEAIIKSGKPVEALIEYRKNTLGELTAGFLHKYKKYPQIIDLKQVLSGKEREELCDKTIDALGDARALPAKISEEIAKQAGVEQDSSLVKQKEILAIIQRALPEKAEEAQKILASEAANHKNALVAMVQIESERRFQEALSVSVAAAREEAEKTDQLIQDIVLLVFAGKAEGAGILANYRRKAEIRHRQFLILEQAGDDRKKILEGLKSNKFIDEEDEYGAAKTVLTQKNKLIEEIEPLKKAHEALSLEMMRANTLDAKAAVGSGQGDMVALAQKYGFKLEHAEILRKCIAEGDNLSYEYFQQAEELAQKYGLTVDQIAQVARGRDLFAIANIPKEISFLEKTFTEKSANEKVVSLEPKLKIKKFQDEKGFLHDFFRPTTEPLTVRLMRRLFGQLSVEESEALEMAVAPTAEKVAADYKNAQKSVERLKTVDLPQVRALLEQRKARLKAIVDHSAGIKDELARKRLQKILVEKIAETKRLLQEVPVEFKNEPSGDETAAALKENDPLILRGAEEGLEEVAAGCRDVAGLSRALEREVPNLETLLKELPENLAQKFQPIDLKPFLAETANVIPNLKSASQKRAQEALQAQERKIDQFAALRNLVLRHQQGEQVAFEPHLKNTQNLNGEPVLNYMSDADFDKTVGERIGAENAKNKIAFIDWGNDWGEQKNLKIYIRKNKEGSPDLNSFLAHESAHAVDIFAGFSASEKFLKKIAPRMKDDLVFIRWQKLIEADKSQDFAQELFAHFLAKDFRPGTVGQAVERIASYFSPEELTKILDDCLPAEDAFKANVRSELVKSRFWKSAEGAAASVMSPLGIMIDDQAEITPERKEKLTALFEEKKHTLEQKLKSIAISDAADKEIFISGIREHLAALEAVFAGNIENDCLEVLGEDGIGKLIGSCNAALSKIAEKAESQAGYFETLWDNTTLLSFADIGRLWTVFSDYMKRRHERRSKLRSGKAGYAMFKGINKKLAAEYDLQVESAEKEEVNKYQESLDNKDSWQIYDRIEETGNKDELKACGRELAKRGMLDLRDRRLWRALERFQSTVHFVDSDADDASVLNQKMQKVYAVLYDNDEFRALDRDNQNAYESRKKDYDKEALVYQDNLRVHLCKMLLQKRNGTAPVDPHRYDAFIERAVRAGKMAPEDIVYFLIQGVYEGVLPLERPNRYGSEFLNDFPSLDFFQQRKPGFDFYNHIGAMFSTKDGNTPREFHEWYHANFLTDQVVVERTKKSVGNAQWDHDWMQSIASIGFSSGAREVCAIDQKGSPVFKTTAFPNLINGILVHFAGTARHPESMAREELKEEWARQFGYAANIDGILYDRIYKKDRLFRMTSEKDEVARGNTYGKSLTTKEVSGKIREIMKAVDQEFFGELFKDQPNLQKLQGILQSRYFYALEKNEDDSLKIPESVDKIYEQITPYMKSIFKEDESAIDRATAKAREIYASDNPGKVKSFIKWDWFTKNKDDAPHNPYRRES